ncbi:gamma-glutamyltransferase [Halopseudomonas salegens]|uniref:Glutathione hydrolase proenzyme n=1 Tax=Halopseudomonas salegens TaxID=1434072 RepID=A0A1H2H413_9GAMM|nr:gamma-glutamyltransferase [Halopseudomonas salegens]SDU26572.1 gamma-glutamyltransferase 1 Threonine peptidase. MEROPS family T03 [Halopseudomonas salegens]
MHKYVALPLLSLLVACSGSDPATDTPAMQSRAEREASRHMISAPHPLAAEAGREILRQGGSAADAAIAAKLVLGLVEAPETGIGGGGFILLHDANRGQSRFYDGRETAPRAATADRFRWPGLNKPFILAMTSGDAVGVPGMLALMAKVHAEHGQLAWASLFVPAIELAEQGIPMPSRLQRQIKHDWSLRLFADTRQYFRRQAAGEPPRLHNPKLAATLRQLAEEGPDSFYHGAIGEQFVQRVQDARWGSGDMQLSDLHDYAAFERPPVCATYRQWTLCGPPPPSSGGLTVLQILGILEHFPMDELSADDPQSWHLIAEASRLAFADRDYYIGDPDFVQVPLAELLERDYLARRAHLIDPRQAMAEPLPGVAGSAAEHPDAELPVPEPEYGTSHLSVVDSAGNLVAFTGSNEAPFGSRMLSQGFVLNSQLTDFNFNPRLGDREHPNAVAGGKRPRSSMSPFIVYDADDKPIMVIGSRGGSRIIGYVVKSLVASLDWEMELAEALAMPNMVERRQGIELEADTWLADHAEALRSMGHRVRLKSMTSGVHAIQRIDGGWRGAADPRLDGVVLGD